MHRSLFGLALLLLVAITLPACAASPSSSDSLEHFTLKHNGNTRDYYVYVPPQVRNSGTRVPLVIALHGGGGNGKISEKMTGFSEKALQEGFIVAYPNGSGRLGNILLTWNTRHCCGYAMKHNIDDVGFISAMIDQMVSTMPVDPKRVYATGMSNGAMMSLRLGSELSDKIAAIAPVVGTMFGDEQRPAMPVSALIINGATDKHIPLGGGKSGGKFTDAWDDMLLKPIAYQGLFWATVDGCNLQPKEQSPQNGMPVARWQYACPAGVDVVRYLMLEAGHSWPGGKAGHASGDAPSTAMNATDVIWDFFKAHSR